MSDTEHTGPGPNDTLPCPSESARLRHLALGQVCEVCGVGAERLPEGHRGVVR